MDNPKLQKVIDSNITKSVLLTLGATALIGTLIVFPGLGYVIQAFTNDKNRERYIKTVFHRLEKQKLVSIKEFPDGKVEFKVTQKGQERILRYKLEDMKIPMQKKWDNLWRVIIFDIPEKKKAAREIFRKNIKQLGFYQLQKSVFVCPYPCKNEIDFLKHNFGIADNITYLVAKKIENDEPLKNKFKL